MKNASIVKRVLSILGILVCGFLIWAIGLIGGLSYHDSETGVSFRISNNGSRPLSKIQILFRGGECNLETLDPGKSVDLRLNISGESGLSLSFLDRGQLHKQTIDVYLERGTSNFSVTVGENDEIYLMHPLLP